LVFVSWQPITRNRVTTEELQWIISWILDHSSVQSGTESIRVLLQDSTIQEAYEHYVEETIQNTMFTVRSQSFFEVDSFSWHPFYQFQPLFMPDLFL
jgi:trehalose-6-phosphate synthase